MEQLLKHGLEVAATAGAEYVELTGVEVRTRSITNINGSLASWGGEEAGIAVRLIAAGRWGFAAGPAASKTAVGKLTKAALAKALVLPKPKYSVTLSPTIPAAGAWEGACVLDPFDLSDDEHAAVLQAADEAMAIPGVEQRQSNISFRREKRCYLNSEGSQNFQTFTLTGGGIIARSFQGGEMQQRSWPSPVGGFAQAGYEYIDELGLPRHGRRIAQEAVALIKAPPCPREVLDLILTGPFAASLVHHTLALNLQLGNLGFISPASASRINLGLSLNLASDATVVGGAGSLGFDSEGTKAQAFPLVEAGRVLSFLSGRETASSVGRYSSGNMRSECWLQPPAPRPTNLIVEPGPFSLGSLLAGIERGVLLDNPRSPVGLCPERRSFATQAELGWLVEKGVVTHMLKTPFLRGNVIAFWNGLDAVGAEQSYYGIAGSSIPVGYKIPPLRIRSVGVGGER